MSSDATPVSSPEGLRFDEPAPGAGTPACARCRAPITAAYYEVNGHVVCAGCRSALEKTPAGSGAARLLKASVGLTYLAIVSTYVPFIVKSARERPGKASPVAASPAAAPVAASDSVAVLPVAGRDSVAVLPVAGKFALGVLALVAIAAAAPFLAGFENVLGLVIIGFALFQAWKMNRRMPLTFNGPYAVGRAAGANGE